ncbi:MAG: DUF3343 domain-containing protein [Candidatus Stahlbacteria bacterium]|nr:DUF3343 domain-containing protein [Candidatus Stahlbacteria bacterium]
MKYVLTFASTHFAMKGARLLKRDGFDVLVIPIPRKISSECGIAVEVGCEDEDRGQRTEDRGQKTIERVKQILEKEKCGVTGVYEWKDKR